ncbi:hypothetical protein [Anabaena lutea]|uniref:Uncharacterized protein n=1 Tax=Anabaena lutea FACHB-196 TaxID=2692881 RepID=A0ABR8FK43_9NOST|nr:hypothetical protein [Anabaena lutea]MBD2570047.1 hypothetical protein [Anabaena lutea FACHB-196]
MPFIASDRFRIIKHLPGVTLAQAGSLLAAISDEDIIAEIQACLDALDALKEALSTERSGTDAALIRVDVLEWSPGGRTSGMETERLELRNQLAILLGLESWGSFSNLSGSVEFHPI